MTDDQHGEGTPQGGGRWDPLPQGDYDDGATAFVQLPEGGIDALLAAADSPLAAPGHGYVPPQITVTPGPGTDPAAPGTWGVPPEGARWPEPGAAHQGAGQDRFTYDPGVAGQWHFEEAAGQQGDAGQPQAAPAPGHDVTGQWSIPVANGDLPDESGEFTTSALVEQWGGTPPATLPGGAPAPWATGTGEPWGHAAGQRFSTDAPEAHPADGTGAGAAGHGSAQGAPGGQEGVQTPERPAGAPQDAPEAPEGAQAAEGPSQGPGEDLAGAGSPAAQAAEEAAPAGFAPTADAQAGAAPAGDVPIGAVPTGAASAGDVQNGATPAGNAPAGDVPIGAAPAGDVPIGAAPAGNVPAGDVPIGAAPAGDVPAGDVQNGAVSAGDTQAGNAQAGAVPVGDARSGTVPVGPESAGEPVPAGPGSEPDAAAAGPAGTVPHEEHPLASYVLRVNGSDRPVTDAWIGESLLYVLRERLGLAGAKDGCSQGECGACNVQVDGRLVASCLVPAVTAAGSEVRTVEGLAVDGQPSDVQRALARCGAVQCGFCVPGMAMTVHDLLEGNPAPTELESRQALCGNLCRCSGYRAVLEAVQDVVAERAAHSAPDAPEHDAGEPRIPQQAGPGAGVNPSAFESPGTPPGPHDQPYGQGQDGGQA
ncbi:2Fe-2S iron-sulfur cluster-binding protein [Streptomyces cinereospinus]|uniref:2Fe-2S iron-sulfur cluster-binding protein n=1 Tax=Streptomyces cinereospinus TaxID=285561 RepID=A0ABV5N1I2_9ACTN